MEQEASLDSRLRDAASIELPDAARLTGAVRAEIRSERIRQIAAIAALVTFAAILGYWVLRPHPVARLYADAALDHRLEVLEHQPRRWRSDPVDISELAARFSLPDLAMLAPPGYRLQHAKMCGIDGAPALHLVYTNGAQEVSVFVQAKTASHEAGRPERVGSVRMASFETGRLQAIVATSGSSGDCIQFAQFMSHEL